MRIVALISGGKDSCFNMMHCVKNGHDIVAVAHLRPEGKDELDSYMFQTVGHNLIELYAEALGLPLFQRTITGSSVCTESEYTECKEDEVEDLYELLITVKKQVDFDAVSSGAILSNYQRVRVENVCSRIGVQSLAYLWQRKQEELLGEMIQADLDAILIKVASLGLKPKVHLGKTLKELEPFLHVMNEKYELNICGEGGEYETMTLDCPLFLKKIVIDEHEMIIHSDDAFAPVGYLSLKKMHLEDKGLDPKLSLFQRIKECNIEVPRLIADENTCCFPQISTENLHIEMPDINMGESQNSHKLTSPQILVSGDCIWVTEIVCYQKVGLTVEECTVETMSNLEKLLKNENSDMKDISIVNIFCSSMANFAEINSGYKRFFTLNPPARVCVEIPLPEDVVYKMEAFIDKSCTRKALHVQSLSYWAPANIGPYSQVVSVGNQACFSGSIGMNPASLNMVNEGVETEGPLSLSHVNEVTKVFIPQMKKSTDYGIIHCYIVDHSKMAAVKRFFENQTMFNSSRYLLNLVVVPSLPKNALIEWNVISKWLDEDCDDIELHGDDVFTYNNDFFKLKICLSEFQDEKSLNAVLENYFRQNSFMFKKTSFMRVNYIQDMFKDVETLKCVLFASLQVTIANIPALSFIPVIGLENDALTLTGMLHN